MRPAKDGVPPRLQTWNPRSTPSTTVDPIRCIANTAERAPTFHCLGVSHSSRATGTVTTEGRQHARPERTQARVWDKTRR